MERQPPVRWPQMALIDAQAAADATSSSHGPTKPSSVSNCLKGLLDLLPHRGPVGLRYAGEHLVQGAEGVPLKPDALGRRRQPQGDGDRVDPYVLEPGRVQGLFEDTRRAEAEGARLTGLGRREL